VEAYPAYKNSGLEWLGTIPEHWKVKRVKAITSTHKQGYYTEQAYVDDGVKLARITDIDDFANVSFENMPFVDVSSKDERAFALEKGDFLFARSGTIGRFGFRGCDPSFLRFAFSSHFFKESLISTLHGGANQNVHAENIKERFLPVPTPPEQRSIAAFLDRETAKIDALVKKKERLIGLFQEKRTALITRAVTKGLPSTDSGQATLDVPMKDSGVEWLGEIPAHWEVKRIKHLAMILRGKFSHRPRNDPTLYDGPYPFIQTGDIASANKYVREYQQTLNEAGYAVSKEFPDGTLVMAIAANIGDLAILGFRACFPDSIVGFVPQPGVKLEYLFYNLTAMRPEMLSAATLNTQMNLNIERIGSLFTVDPPQVEQEAIVELIECETAEIDALIAKIREGIEKLKEYRTALISAAVTGKIDVREQIARTD
jgi:type I restriction enzyme, S subunit